MLASKRSAPYAAVLREITSQMVASGAAYRSKWRTSSSTGRPSAPFQVVR